MMRKQKITPEQAKGELIRRKTAAIKELEKRNDDLEKRKKAIQVDAIKLTFSPLLRLRNELGIQQSKVIQETGSNQMMIYRFESGITDKIPRKILEFAVKYGADRDQFIREYFQFKARLMIFELDYEFEE